MKILDLISNLFNDSGSSEHEEELYRAWDIDIDDFDTGLTGEEGWETEE